MFIPIGDDNSQRRTTPIVVWLLVLGNIVGWFLELTRGERFMVAFATIPFEITHGVDLVAKQPLSVHGEMLLIPQAPGPSPIYLTVLTSMFLHGSWGHIIGNMVYLLIFGDQIEDRLGHLRFLLFYLGAGVVAALAQVWGDPSSIVPCVGASGAIAGVLGAYLLLYPRNTVRMLFFRSIINVPASIVLGMWGVMQVLGQLDSASSQAPGVAYLAHLGGFAVGFVVSAALVMKGGRQRRSWR
jgi:membrane associated rhomboid family serine protease